MPSAKDLTTLFLASNIEQINEQESEYEEVEHKAEQEIDNKEIDETEQENDFEDLSSIRDTGLLDDIELEDSNIKVEIILSSKSTKAYTQPNSKYMPYSILSNTFKDTFNLTIQWVLL
ncbi:hypothetical protein F8M41_022379 [Gigaspora margarita]|uniref:Uncharacterized protein n=1 Tax=Gigaspora margarita TaxID=4874 RepID=A0A8H4ETP3_GIGMA|nr:hypothetical protein F8M41_022379 [Gigaspora margarita]